MKAGAILVAAGRGDRAGGLKQFELLAGQPLFCWSLHVLQASPNVDTIVLVVPSGWEDRALDQAVQAGCRSEFKVVAGGLRRQDSVRMGLNALVDCELVVVHDAARPFLTADLVEGALQAAGSTGAASIGCPVTDALKRVDEDALVVESVDREGLWAMQTPQAFQAELLQRAHSEVTNDVPDDAAMVEMIGAKVRVLEGPGSNMKITSAQDFALAEALMRSSTNA